MNDREPLSYGRGLRRNHPWYDVGHWGHEVWARITLWYVGFGICFVIIVMCLWLL